MHRSILPLSFLIAGITLSACSKPEPPDHDAPPEPQAAAQTASQPAELAQAIQQPLDKANAAQSATEAASKKQDAAIEDATGDSAGN